MDKLLNIKLSADISNMQKNLSKMATQVKKSTGEAREYFDDNFEKGTSEAKKHMKDVTNESKKLSSGLKKVFGAVATTLSITAIAGFTKQIVETTAEVKAMESQFSQTFGTLEKNASKSLGNISKETGVAEGRMKGSFTKITAFAKTTGMETEDAMKLGERAMRAIADSSAYYDRSLEETTESLQSFLKGNYENDAALGLSCTETTRNAKANELYGKSFKDLSEEQKQLTLLQMVEDANKLSGAFGQASRESDTWTNQIGNLREAWRQFQVKLGENILDSAVGIVKKLVEALNGITKEIPKVIEWFKKYKVELGLATLWIGLLSGAVWLYNKNLTWTIIKQKVVIGLTKVWTVVTKALSGAMAFLTSPIGLIVIAIGLLVAGFVIAYKKSDKFRALVNKLKDRLIVLWDKIKEGAKVIKENLTDKFNEAMDYLKPFVDMIRNNFTKTLEDMKRPLQEVKESFSALWTKIKDDLLPLIKERLAPIFEKLKENIGVLVKFLGGVLVTAVGTAIGIFNGIASCLDEVVDAFSGVIDMFGGLIDIIVGVFTGDKEKIINGAIAIKDGIIEVFSSMWEGTKDFFGGLSEGLVGFFKPLFDKMGITEWWNNIETWMNEKREAWKTKLDEWKNSITTWFTEKKDTLVNGITGWWDSLTNWIDEKKTEISNKFNSWKEEIGKCFKDKDYLIDKLEGWIERINGWTEEKAGEIGEKFNTWKESISNWFTEKKETFKEGFKEWWSNVTTWFTEKKEEIPTKIEEWKEKISKWFTDKKETFKNGFTEWWDKVVEWFTTTKENLPANLDEWKESIKKWFTDKKDALVNGFSEWMDNVKTWFTDGDGKKKTEETGKEVPKKMSDGIKKKATEPAFIKKLGNTILKLIGAALLAVLVGIVAVGVALVTGIWEGIKKAFKWVKEKFKKKFNELREKASEVWDGIVKDVKDLPSRMGEAIGKGAKWLANGFIKLINAPIKWFLKGINYIIKGINFVYKKITGKKEGLIGEIQVSKWEIPQLAKGTNSWKGGTALVGEAGRELVSDPRLGTFMADKPMLLPLSKGASVLRNSKTEKLLSDMGIPAFAKGKKESSMIGTAWNTLKDWGSAIGDKIGDVWSYIKEPSKLINKVIDGIDLGFENSPLLKGMASGVKNLFKGNFIIDWVKNLFANNDKPVSKAGSKGLSKYITSGFGWRLHPILGNRKYHSGIDLAGGQFANGMPVYSQSSGKVLTSGYSNSAGYWVQVAGDGGTYRYMHMQKGSLTKKAGDSIKAGEQIGKVGSTGRSTGPHLHFDFMKGGQYRNPLQWFGGYGYKAFANGGLIKNATMSLMGERGTEAVVPLSNAHALKPFGDAVANSLTSKTNNTKVEDVNVTYEFTIPVMIDGKEVAKATATFTKAELDKLEKREGRRNGRK